jgi:aminoglycoside phosphotransferase (APT) family kinase protein
VSLQACLPVNLQGPSTTITKVAAGLSGAGVHRVECPDGTFVLKVSAADEPLENWRAKINIQQLAADAGLAPRIVHTDEAQRAVLSDFVVDRSFPALLMTPTTREAAIVLLGRTLRRVHELPLPADASRRDPREFLAETWSSLDGTFATPTFVGDAVRDILAAEPLPPERGVVLSHNDVNPSNVVYDGERLLLLDWDTAGANDPFYDLAAISVFFRMDEPTCQRLLAAHDDAPVTSLPVAFFACRRIVAVLCGTMFMKLARQSGHAGATGEETLESTLSLGDFYQRLRTGSVNIASGDGQWLFGLALVREAVDN